MKFRVYKGWHLHAHRMPMWNYHLGVTVEFVPDDNFCLSIHLLWLGSFFLQLDNADSLHNDTYL